MDTVAAAAAAATAGRYATGLASIDLALSTAPDDARLLAARAGVLHAWGRFHEAQAAAERAESRGASSVPFLMTAGWSCFFAGSLVAAEAKMRRAVTADPHACATHSNLAVVLQAQGRLDEAAACYLRALDIVPDDVQCLLNLGVCRVDQGAFAEGEALLRRAIAVDSGRARPWANLGVALAQQRRLDEAIAAFERADRLGAHAGEPVDGVVNHALLLREADRTDDALGLYETYLPTQPILDGHNDYAFALLTDGRLIEGWNHYEFRWIRQPLLDLRPAFDRPVWNGQDLRGKTILLRAEQGFGDAIHFIRYMPWVKALGATVLLQVRSGLERLAAGCDGVDRVLDREQALPEFDFYINLPSLPRVFGTTLGSIPAAIPYIRTEPSASEKWRNRLSGLSSVKVGLGWAGSPTHSRDRYRSISLRELSPLLSTEGVTFVSLQKGEAAAEAKDWLVGVEWIDAAAELEDFADTAALIGELDLVICVDTAVAHLAGALGKAVWVMVAQPADFRWLERREDSPWYPTLRLFRQSRRDDWEDVVRRVAAALAERVKAGGQALPAAPTPRREVARPVTTLAGIKAGQRAGLSAVAETRVGIVQYLPEQPVVGDAIGWYGEHLQQQLELLGRLLQPGARVLEASAGIGLHALFLSRVVGETGHLYVYEARPLLQRILRQNLAANRVRNATVMRRALGSQGEAASGAGETIDELRLEGLDWLKVGEGGAAPEVIVGAAETLWRLRPKLFLAADDQAMLAMLAERAQAFSYRCWRVETGLFNRHNFNRRHDDIFAGRAALALLAIPEEIEVDVALDGCVEIS